jgi:hypothetical protein
MTAMIPVTMALARPVGDIPLDKAELAAAAFFARYKGRTLDVRRSRSGAFARDELADGRRCGGLTALAEPSISDASKGCAG